MNRPVVLMHGAFHGAWCWDRVTCYLDAAGVPWRAPDLPSCANAASGAAIDEDTAAVESVLDNLPDDEPAVLLGHSRGVAAFPCQRTQEDP
jgi:pimeloyl-ACP methyl ester carboxylesterase